eukprot:CAMPEP_0206439058 /NCGR_PEP_ID=MMETSP0324_2-20121206/11992_1 /ASSEMBLY_ACC=CAM_ASM_000836 /TAXON_ID=2866 /ORGANISM="Crypthecodinium cohnii, Strain Seligo" /LENGTH=509 /DNA_ID=CAMNT_0053906621 /DNA_START=20 /DNA_END=1549 /DNA_ORIENTATION=+
MKFRSTRDTSTTPGPKLASFEEVISKGYAPDGGLYVPEKLPQVSKQDLECWRNLSFPALAEQILLRFVGEDLPGKPEEFTQLVCSCYEDFTVPDVVPVKRVGSLLVSELFHGPTFCFKDLGLQPLLRLLSAYAQRADRKHNLLVSTTGDTGPAALRAVSDVASKNLSMIVFFPEGQISELQRKQMTTLNCSSARVATFQGGGDDMDLPLKRLAADRAFAQRHGLCGINSYNLGRPLAQLSHFFWSYFRALDLCGLQVGDVVDIVIPCGALGNLAAGFMAKCMGLPVRRFVAATNANDITHRTFDRGEFHRSDEMEKTLSDAINIQVPYNMERLLYYLTGEDSALVSSWMKVMDETGKLTLPDRWLNELKQHFSSRRVDDEATCKAMEHAYRQHQYLADPHTSVALSAAWHIYGEEADPSASPPVVVMATASPCKFEDSVSIALGSETWQKYIASSEFPEAARQILQAKEKAFDKLEKEGSLKASQSAWESAVREWLGGKKKWQWLRSKL